MDHQMYRRQPQARSNSIGDHEFNYAVHQRLKQAHYTHHSPYVDASQYYNQRTRYLASGHQFQPADRSVSPMNFGGRAIELGLPQRGGSIKYPLDSRHPRNHLHASLECLNVGYSDYAQNQNSPQQQQPFMRAHLQQQQQYQQNNQFQNQHYAASYVLAAAPDETVISQNAEQDLAAAAMGNPPTVQHYNQMAPMASSSSGVVTPQHNSGYHQGSNSSYLHRATSAVPQSPLHRRVLTHTQNGAQGVLNHTANGANNSVRAGHSSLSLASSTNLIENKLQLEIKKLENDLKIEKEKNEALNSQLEMNSSLMAAFEQSLNTLNTRVRQLSTINEKKDREIEELRSQLDGAVDLEPERSELFNREVGEHHEDKYEAEVTKIDGDKDNESEQELRKIVVDLRRQVIEKDRLLTDTRLAALSAAHQLEQMEAKLNGDSSMVVNEGDLDEGVMVVNHSPGESELASDSAHCSEITSQTSGRATNEHQQHLQLRHQGNRNGELLSLMQSHDTYQPDSNNTSSLSNNSNTSNQSADESNGQNLQPSLHHHYQLQPDNQSNDSSSDYHVDDKSPGDICSQKQTHRSSHEPGVVGCNYNDEGSEAMSRLLDTIIINSNGVVGGVGNADVDAN